MSITVAHQPPAASDVVVVTGATGRIGGLVLRGLTHRRIPVRPTSRDRTHDAVLDWADGGHWSADLFTDAGRAFLLVPEQLGYVSGAVTDFVAQGAARGVRHWVLVSAMGLDEAGADIGMPAVEAAVTAAAGTAGTASILRCNTLAQNFSRGMWAGEIEQGVLTAPVGDARVSFVDVADVADAAIALLTDPSPPSGVFQLTGPQALTFAEVAEVFSRQTGRQVRFADVSPDDYASHLRHGGLPPFLVERLSGFMATLASGRHEVVTGDVERLTGHAARSLAGSTVATVTDAAPDLPGPGRSRSTVPPRG